MEILSNPEAINSKGGHHNRTPFSENIYKHECVRVVINTGSSQRAIFLEEQYTKLLSPVNLSNYLTYNLSDYIKEELSSGI